QDTTFGYNMNVTSLFNHGNVETHNSLSVHVPALAYIDDIIWLSQSKESLNSLLCIADSFYELNSIQINWIKSTLLSPFKNQNAVHFQLLTSALNLIPAKYNSSIRYLGIWISMSNNKQFIQKQVQLDLHTATHALRSKVLTDKQIIYIYNFVILPKIMYRMQLTFLGHKVCDKLMGSFRRILKTKLFLSNDTPIAAFHTPS
ncbi:15388_t:CDS:1, partial [Funneliformis geosporum]